MSLTVPLILMFAWGIILGILLGILLYDVYILPVYSEAHQRVIGERDRIIEKLKGKLRRKRGTR